MRIPENTPTKNRVIQGAIYAAAGQPDMVFKVPRPFVPDDFGELAKRLQIDPEGFANQANQVLAENVASSLSRQIKAAAQAGKPLPTQEDLDALVERYDFSGIRASTGETTTMTPLEREQMRLAKQVIRGILKTTGFGDMPPPVTVAKGKEPGKNQITQDELINMAIDLVEGNAPWDAGPFAEKRAELLEQAEANIVAIKDAALSLSQKLAM